MKQWIDKVDQAGITILSEGGYDFFLSLELQTYESIRQLQQTVKGMNVESVVERTLDNEDILFHWAMLSLDISNEKDSSLLLTFIIRLWIKMRGHSYALAITEAYKEITGHQVKRAKSLRKQLKYGNESGEFMC